MKHLIAKHLVDKHCRTCSCFGGVIENFMFNLQKIKCKTVGVRDDVNCEACVGTLTYLTKIGVSPLVIYTIAQAIDKQQI